MKQAASRLLLTGRPLTKVSIKHTLAVTEITYMFGGNHSKLDNLIVDLNFFNQKSEH
jgi:hypothetical protein